MKAKNRKAVVIYMVYYEMKPISGDRKGEGMSSPGHS